jgi:hypothetical protein
MTRCQTLSWLHWSASWRMMPATATATGSRTLRRVMAMMVMMVMAARGACRALMMLMLRGVMRSRRAGQTRQRLQWVLALKAGPLLALMSRHHRPGSSSGASLQRVRGGQAASRRPGQSLSAAVGKRRQRAAAVQRRRQGWQRQARLAGRGRHLPGHTGHASVPQRHSCRVMARQLVSQLVQQRAPQQPSLPSARRLLAASPALSGRTLCASTPRVAAAWAAPSSECCSSPWRDGRCSVLGSRLVSCMLLMIHSCTWLQYCSPSRWPVPDALPPATCQVHEQGGRHGAHL